MINPFCCPPLVSLGVEFRVPGTRLSQPDPEAGEPHKPALQHQTRPRGRAVEGRALRDPRGPPTKDLRNYLQAADHGG